MFLPISPLCLESDINVYRPPIEFFIEKIRKNEYFSFTRQMHGLWDAVIVAWILDPSLRAIQLENPAYLKRLSEKMSEAKLDIEGLYYQPSFYAELLEILGNLPPITEQFFFGVSDTYFFPQVPRLTSHKILSCLINAILNI